MFNPTRPLAPISFGSPRRPPRRRASCRAEALEPRALLSTATPRDPIIRPAVEISPLVSPPATAAAPNSPAVLRSLYGLDRITFLAGFTRDRAGHVIPFLIPGDGSGQTIAIVEVGDNSHLASNLYEFDKAYGLPDPVLTKVDYQGGAPGTPADAHWATETDLDVQWAHAMAPGAKILVVEARSASRSDLFAAVNYARYQPGVDVVSMSWGEPEFPGESSYDSLFQTPAGHLGGSSGWGGAPDRPGGVSFVASSGDNGMTQYPAASFHVLAVGGTRLDLTTPPTQSAWDGSGGGISLYERDGISWYDPGYRFLPDVAGVAQDLPYYDPYFGPDSGDWNVAPGWFTVTGTSASAPQWAGLIAVADQGRALVEGLGSLYNPVIDINSLPNRDFHDVTTGAVWRPWGYQPAGPGWDFATGWGTPNAVGMVDDLLKAEPNIRMKYPFLASSSDAGPSTSSSPAAGATSPVKVSSLATSRLAEFRGVEKPVIVPDGWAADLVRARAARVRVQPLVSDPAHRYSVV